MSKWQAPSVWVPKPFRLHTQRVTRPLIFAGGNRQGLSIILIDPPTKRQRVDFVNSPPRCEHDCERPRS